MTKLIISLAQINIALGDTRKNIKQAEEAIEEAARRGSHLIVLPELWSTGYALEQGKDLASPLNVGVLAQ